MTVSSLHVSKLKLIIRSRLNYIFIQYKYYDVFAYELWDHIYDSWFCGTLDIESLPSVHAYVDVQSLDV